MTKTQNQKSIPFSLRLTAEEHRQLKAQAGGMSLAAYIRSLVFRSKTRARGKASITQHFCFSQILALLGKSQLAISLEQIARAAANGCLSLSPETEKDIQTAVQDIRTIKRLLMAALGIQER